MNNLKPLISRYFIRVFWPGKISNNKLLQDTKQESIDNTIRKRRWRWHGHVMRMNPDIPAKTALTRTPEGKRKKGRPRTTWRRTMEEELCCASQTWDTARRVARNRGAWKDLVEASCATRHEEK